MDDFVIFAKVFYIYLVFSVTFVFMDHERNIIPVEKLLRKNDRIQAGPGPH